LFDDSNGGTWLAQKGSLTEWDVSLHMFTPPVFVGDDFYWVSWEPQGSRVMVQRNGETIFQFSAMFMVKNPVQALVAYDGHWVLEVDGFLIQDGKNLNNELGYDEIFGFSLVKGRPFYFFTKDGLTRINYNGEVLPVEYDSVVHYNCCEPAMFNNGSNASMVWFYALKDGKWNYVEIGNYEK
jgi:hypothetical protein